MKSTRDWIIPTYTYDRETTLGTLLQTFFAANRHSKTEFAQDLGCNVLLIDRWLAEGITSGLNSRFKDAFERLTHIELERLYVIEAKKNILRNLSSVESVRQSDPSLARLLERTPDLATRIVFDVLTTRDEVIHSLRQIAERSGFPILALQVGIDDSSMSAWKPQSGRRPYDQTLARSIIAIYSKLHTDHPDSARFMVAGEAILGNVIAEMGITSLETAIDVLFEGIRDRALSVIASKTHLNPGVVKSLLHFTPSGKIGWKTLLSILRALFERREKKRLGTLNLSSDQFKRTLEKRLTAFDERTEQFEKESDAGQLTLPPLTDPTEDVRERAQDVTPEPQVPTPNPPVQKPLQPLHPPQPTSPQEQPTQPDLTAQIRAIAASLLTQEQSAKTQFEVLRLQFPEVLGDIKPTTVIQSVPTKQESKTNTARSIVDQLKELIGAARAVCKLPVSNRSQILRQLDPLLVELQRTIESAGTLDPEEYLRLHLSGRAAGELFRS